MSKRVSFNAKPSNRSSSAEADKWVEQRTTPEKLVEPMKRFTFDIPESLHRRLKTSCALRGSHMVDEIRELLEKNYHD